MLQVRDTLHWCLQLYKMACPVNNLGCFLQGEVRKVLILRNGYLSHFSPSCELCFGFFFFWGGGGGGQGGGGQIHPFKRFVKKWYHSLNDFCFFVVVFCPAMTWHIKISTEALGFMLLPFCMHTFALVDSLTTSL